MDSKLLNVYHDETYEANYDHFESSVWSSDNIGLESMGLASTLHGILPIAATETDQVSVCDTMFDDDNIYGNKDYIQTRNKDLLVYNDFEAQQLKAEERVGTIETDLLRNVDINNSNISDDFDNSDPALDALIDNDDARSQDSQFSYRTRTESSSIGDYESHSSDYDDDDDDYVNGYSASDFDEEELEKDDILADLPEIDFGAGDIITSTKSKKYRTISTNTIGSDVDPANFDLAEFITNDGVTTKSEVTKVPGWILKPVVQVISSKIEENDSDSDAIVDVETVEFEEVRERTILLKNASIQLPEDNLAYVDNVKEDPSWSPTEVKTKHTSSKKQIDTSRGGKTPGKSILAPKSNDKGAKKQILKSTPSNVQTQIQNRGVGKGGKNLSLLKRDCESIKDDNSQVRIKENKDIALLKHDSHRIDPRMQSKNLAISLQKNETEKRKLNLEEYKRRQGEDLQNVSKAKTIENKSTTPANQKSTINPPTPTKTKIHSEAVTSIVKSLREEKVQNGTQKVDPITQAKNKVLRMQELKRAQQMKIIDSTISAKVPRVTKLLPLQEIIKDTAYAIKSENQSELKPELQANSDYVTIVMVSAACNTALSLAPTDVLPNVPLLNNIARVPEHIKISNSSLITSIQDAVVKQSIPKPTESCTAGMSNPTTADVVSSQHGEDKIIMHLRKDRIRGQMHSICVQTDYQAAFPTLPFPGLLRRKFRKRNYSTSSSSDSSHSDDESDHRKYLNDSDVEYISTKQNHQSSCVPATNYQNSEAAISVGGYSSRSSRRHRSSVSSSYSESGQQRSSRSRKRKSSYRARKSARKHTHSSSSSSTLSDYSDRSRSRSRHRNRTRSRSPYHRNERTRYESNNFTGDRNVSKPAVEERRIVYIGRIEEETTKEMLRRKFIVYGPIKQITIHYKETGMKYGFVTFERSQDAFSVIDNSAQDSQINMYDISFGGRRAFCRTSYADLDNAGINNYHSYVFPKVAAPPKQEDSFEALLQKVKAKLDANKSTSCNKM